MRVARKESVQKGMQPPREGKRSAYVRALEKDHEELELQHETLLQAQLVLETSRDHYAELYDGAPVCFVTLTQKGVIREINHPGMHLLNPRQRDFKGWPFTSFVAPGDKKIFIAHLSRCRSNRDVMQPMSVELKLARKGSEKPVFIELVSLPSAKNELTFLKCVFRDITEIKEMQEVHRWLAGIVESTADAIIGKDLDGRIISCNRGAERLFGYPGRELVGKPMTVLIPQDLQKEELEILQRLRRGEKMERYETTRQRKDGTLVPVSLTISPIRDDHDRIIGISNIAHDITERKEGERKLEESLKREKAANRAKDDFLAALSHELRTPLNPVLLLASDGVRNADFSPQARMDFNTIRQNVELEARLIDDMLDLTRITRGKLTLETKPVDVHSALHDAAGTVHADVEHKKIELVLNLNAEKPIVTGDSVRLRQIFWNLLKNAVKFTPDGGKIIVETRLLNNGQMVITVTDTGIGISLDEIKRIFGAFAQGTHQFGGLGLGLAISRALVELHSGAIRAESPGKGHGATFTIELPLAKESKVERAATADIRPVARVSGKGIRILLVEDHEPTRTSLTHLLLRRDYKVVPAGSLSEARNLLEKEKFNLLISDIGLPDGNGCDLMEECRRDLKGIALTGFGREQDISRSQEAGFIAHLTKPVRIESLDDVLVTATKGLGANG
ncbi:MAG TPA: PAS domain S-box protein [Pseudomonadales bacterium]|nr:PAS domain S-box protein [Pseudomonadales bacterium]